MDELKKVDGDLNAISIIIPKDKKNKITNKYNKCDGIPTILNTLYLIAGIPFIVILVIVCLYFCLFLSIDYTYLSLFFIICIYVVSFLLPILLTYSHIKSVKKKCFNYGNDIKTKIAIVTPVNYN